MVAAGGVGVGGLGRLPPPGDALRVLSDHESNIIEGIASVLFPPGHFSVTGGDGGTAPVVDAIVADMMEPAARIAFRFLLRAVDIAALVARGVRFVDLPQDEKREVIDIWFSENPSPRRMASDSFKVVVGMGFLRRPEVLKDIGWRTGCLGLGPT